MPNFNLAEVVGQAANGDIHDQDESATPRNASQDAQAKTNASNGDATPTRVNGTLPASPSQKHIPELSKLELPQISHFRSLPSTPSMRTGPPRSLSFVYSHPNSPANSRSNSKNEPNGGDILEHTAEEGDFTQGSYFRGAFDSSTATPTDRKGKKRESRFLEESWNPMKWFHDSPNEEKSGMDLGGPGDAGPSGTHEDSEDREPPLKRAQSEPQSPSSEQHKGSRAKWNRLRSLIPQVASQNKEPRGPSVVTSHAVNITDELIAGGLSTLMLRLWFERDEKGHRRVPILLHRLRIRVSDSLHPLQGHKSVFRIECEYANGAARWVVYRQLRDFLSLHAHYAVSNAYNRNIEDLPEFPKTSESHFLYKGL
jgi:phospholipase D1/2